MTRLRRISVAVVWAVSLAVAAAGLSAQSGPVAGRNVNIVGGPTMLTLDPFDLVGDPLRAQQNEGSCAISPRNHLDILCGANDYRIIDLPGIDPNKLPGDAWAGVFQSRDGGLTWQSRLHPGFGLDSHDSVLKVFPAMADPVVRIGPGGLGFFSGIALERGEKPLGLLFVSTWMNLMAREGDAEPFKHVRTTLVQDGNAGQFIDKPWFALGTPIPGQTCTLDVPAGDGTMVSQTVPRTPVYIAWATFVGHAGNDHTKIYFSRSLDCGVTFSKPLNVSSGNFKNQGVQLVVVPGTNTVFMAWRRGATNSEGDALIVTRSSNGGQSFSSPIAVAEGAPVQQANAVATSAAGKKSSKTATSSNAPATFPYCPFDQGTTPYTFRTTGFPTLAAGGGRAFLFWSQRQGNCSNGVARVMVSSSADGVGWTTPGMVDNPNVPAHQILPSATVAGDKLQVAWFDFRSDASGLFGPFVEEKSVIEGLSPTAPPRRRHTVDVRGAESPVGLNLAFTPYPVSQYIFGIPAGESEKQQLQFNPPNVRMFQKMNVPFISDYLDSAASHYTPVDPVQQPGVWAANTGQLGDTPALFVWTDNRNVKLFSNEDYSIPRPYQRPNLPGLGATSVADPTQTVDQCVPGVSEQFTGSKNQDVYIAPILPRGWFAAAAWNNKPLGFAETPLPDGTVPLLQRAFAVFVRNVTATPMAFDLSIANQPPGGRATFDQFSALPAIHITVPARSMVARTVYVESPAARAAVAVDVSESLGSGHMRVWLNPDPSAPDSLLLPYSVPPNEPAFDIANFEVYDITLGAPSVKRGKLTDGLSNSGWPNPEWENPEWENPEWENPEWENPEWENPEWENQEWQNPEWENPEWENPEWENPEWENGALDSGDFNGTKGIKQFRWRVQHIGNTSAAYSSKVAVLGPTGDMKFQLVAYKLYTTPVTTGCLPNLIGHTQVLSNVTSLDVSLNNFQSVDWEKASSAAHYALEPGEDAYLALVAVGTPQQLAALTADDVVLGTQPQAVNTEDKLAGQTEPDTEISQLVILPAALPDGTTGEAYDLSTLQAIGGTPPYVWSSTGLPAGLTLNPATGVISGTPTAAGTFPFVVAVADSSNPALTAARAFTMTVENSAPNLVFVTQPTNSTGDQAMPNVQVKAQDDGGAALPGVLINMALGDNPGNASLTGTTSALTDATGVATFSSLIINRGGPGYTLMASAPGASPVESVPFHVVDFSNTANMSGDGRVFHTATKLRDGRVLIAGGRGPAFEGPDIPLDTALLFDPATGTWISTGSLNDARQEHTATLLNDGQVLIVGGLGADGYLPSAELYDPDTGTFSYTNFWLAAGRSLHSATLLADGTVLIAGGITETGVTNTAERYYPDGYPDGQLFYSAGPLATARYEHRATLLSNGKVVITGGFNGFSIASVEVFDPYDDSYDGGAFQPAGTLLGARHNHEAVLLPSGKILVAGGVRLPSEGTATLRSAELYDPSTATSAQLANMISRRQGFTATMLHNGTVLLAGGNIYNPFGQPSNTTLDSAEIYDPTAGTFSATGKLAAPRQQFEATLLDDGQVLVTGGSNATSDFLDTAEIYHPLPSGVVTDPVGDSGGSDLVFARVVVDGDTLHMSVRFAPGTFGEATAVQFVFDTDQNPATGHPGSDSNCVNDNGIIGTEFLVNAGASYWEGPEIRQYRGTCNSFSSPQLAGSATLVTDGFDLSVPLSFLGGDSGQVNFKVLTFEYLGGFSYTSVRDYMTNVGLPPGKVQ